MEYECLTRNLLYFHNSSSQVKVFHCLEMKNSEVAGMQRVRSYPFESHQFQGRRLKDTVFFRPVRCADEDGFKLPEDKDSLEYGTVLLFFKIKIRGKLGRGREVSLAFIKYFDKYLVEGMVNNTDTVTFCLYMLHIFLIIVEGMEHIYTKYNAYMLYITCIVTGILFSYQRMIIFKMQDTFVFTIRNHMLGMRSFQSISSWADFQS